MTAKKQEIAPLKEKTSSKMKKMNDTNNINQEIRGQSHCQSHLQYIKGTYVPNRSDTCYRTSNSKVDKI